MKKSISFSFINKSEALSGTRGVAGTKKISQLDNLGNDILTGEAILPVVISDPLIPNRKAKVNQLFRGVSQGSKTAPGLCFDLDRKTGLFQTNYSELGISFGTAGYYFTKIEESQTVSTAKIQAIDSAFDNTNIMFQPKGSGVVTVQSGSIFRLQDTQFEIADDVTSSKKARFEISNIGTGTKTFALPTVTVGNATTLVGTDTVQTITNKVIRIDQNNLFITDDTLTAKFGIDWITTQGTASKTYFFGDPGPSVTSVNIIDDITSQTISNKTLVQPQIAGNISTSNKVNFDASVITATRTVTFPDLNIILVGTNATQTISNKNYQNPIFSDSTDATKKVNFSLSNRQAITNDTFAFPTALNTTGTSILISELATQTLKNKQYDIPVFTDGRSINRKIIFDLTNLTNTRTISFPNEDATLLSTNNVGSLEGITFGGALAADSFGGRLRLRTHFLSAWR
jgi:hypothetical protein